MKVRVRWTCTYMRTERFVEVVDVPYAVDAVDAVSEAVASATGLGRDLLGWRRVGAVGVEPRDTYYIGDSVDEVESAVVVDSDEPAAILAVEGGEPELIGGAV